MQWLLGNKVEEPQRTHPWNWTTIPKELSKWMLEKDKTAPVAADPNASPKYHFGMPVHHLTRFGGWTKFAVLTPSLKEWREGETWYVGWIDGSGACCVSKIPLTTPVRMLQGKERTRFFALDRRHRQITLYATYFGEIGKARPEHAKLPLR